MWNMFMPPYYPYVTPPYGGEKQDDPFRRLMLKQLRKFLKAEGDKEKKKEPNKDQIKQIGWLLLLGMPITGPLYILCMIMMWKLVRMNLQ